jgi:sporulation-specific protein 1
MSLITNAELDINSPSLDPIRLYDIKECVGRGNFGDVFKAISRTSNQIVAIKVINLEESDDEIDVLVQEIKFLSQLKSKYITNYYQTYVRDVSMWIVMEYCGGGSCADLLKCHKYLSEDVVWLIIRDTLKGLEYLHKERKVHRDIKAANILLTANGEVKLADFGVSGQFTETKVKKKTFVGTPYWMAPEIILRGRGYNEKVDIWSLGITTIELVTGSAPYSDCDPMKVLFQIPHNPPPLLIGSNYSEEIKEFVKFCLVKNSMTRPSASVLLKSKFIRNNKRRQTSLVPYIREKDTWMDINRPNLKRPRHSVDHNLYTKSEASFRWNFTRHLPNAMQGNVGDLQSSRIIDSSSPESKVSPFSENEYIDSSETRLTSPDSHVVEKENEIYHVSPPNLTHDIQRKAGLPVDAQDKPLQYREPIDYLNSILLYSLKRVHHRARTVETKITVSNLSKSFITAEREQTGLAEALSEEIWLRMCQLREKRGLHC